MLKFSAIYATENCAYHTDAYHTGISQSALVGLGRCLDISEVFSNGPPSGSHKQEKNRLGPVAGANRTLYWNACNRLCGPLYGV